MASFVKKIWAGYCVYKTILLSKNLPADFVLYYMDYAGSGDTYLCCSFLKCANMIRDNCVFIAPGKVSGEIARLSGFNHIRVISKVQAFNLRKLSQFCGKPFLLQPLLYESEPMIYSGVMRYMQGYRNLNFMFLLENGFSEILNDSYEIVHWSPLVFHAKNTTEYVDSVFKKYGLKKGKTLLIAPYAGNHDLWDIPMEYYKKIADEYRKKGFSVCTNSDGAPQEVGIPGTLPICIPYAHIQEFCRLAGYFISIRSGLCDLLAPVHLKEKSIIYPNKHLAEGPGTLIEFFSLKRMGLCQDAQEVVY